MTAYKDGFYDYLDHISRYIDVPRMLSYSKKIRYFGILHDMSYQHLYTIVAACNKIHTKRIHPCCYDDFLECGFIFPLGLMLEAEVYHKDNFENFNALVDDLGEIERSFYREDFKKIDFFHSSLFLKPLLSHPNYKNLPNFRSFMMHEIANLDTRYLGKIYMLYNRFNELKKDYNSEYLDSIFDLKVKSISENGKDKTYCSNILLAKEGRFLYLNDKLMEVETNRFIRKEIFSYIKKFNIEMFDVLNEGSSEDSFIQCMDIVFDSDTYCEMFNKLKVLKNISDMYRLGSTIDALNKLKDLNNCSYKEMLNDQIVSYPINSINQVEKPKRIIDRMKELYPRFDRDVSYDFLDTIHDVATSVGEVEKVIKRERKKQSSVKVKALRIK